MIPARDLKSWLAEVSDVAELAIEGTELRVVGHGCEERIEVGVEMSVCNDCGAEVYKGDELCEKCLRQQQFAEEYDALHPEHRCPPRE